MKLAWITDIHLNFLKAKARKDFYQNIIDTKPDAILISGDISDAPTISDMLVQMYLCLNKPIYFVLGNHDYYHDSIIRVREKITILCKEYSLLNWLPAKQKIHLTDDVILVGEDCWADGRYGNYTNSPVMLNDSRLIRELAHANMLGKYQLLDKMQYLADKDANNLKNNIKDAIKLYNAKKIIILIHVPPFIQSCMHEGKISNDDYLPFFSSKITGDILLEIANDNQKIDFTVLCGHTHSRSFYQPLDNLTVKTGGAEYTKPTIAQIIQI